MNENLPKILIDYLNYNANLNKSINTINEYKYDLTNFLKYIKWIKNGNRKILPTDIDTIKDINSEFLNNIDLNDIYSYMSYLRDNCNNVATSRARKVASIKSFFKYLHLKAKIIDDNPAKELESPKLGKRLPKYLTLEQSEKLLDNIKNGLNTSPRSQNKAKRHGENNIRDYAMVTLFLNCGMRLSELVNIDIDHIKKDESLLTVIGKGNKERTIYLNKACIFAIEDYLKVRPNITRTR